MFNLKQAKSRANAQSGKIAPAEKALEKSRESLQDVANDNPSIHEELLEKDRKVEAETITEDQMERPKSGVAQILEKNIKHKKLGDLYVPAINAFVEKIVQDRRKEFTKFEKKKENWTTKKPTQNADLPAWPKQAPQPDGNLLPNDVDRKQPNTEPLIGGIIAKASVDEAAKAIKTGATKTYDEQVVNILKTAHDESRDLYEDEKKKIAEIKKSRTYQFLKEV